MNASSIIFIFILIIFAASYGWGMRGTTIGGEKGAMLPGALIGSILALFSGVLIVQENFYIFGALGAIGMYFGGCMTYGETLSFSMSAKPAINIKKGLLALFIKGLLWFGVFGAVFTTGVCAVSGYYKLYELVVIFVITPVFALVGLKIFNKPLDVANVIFPKIYFSKTRKEYWGALVGMVCALLLINIIKLNTYSVIFTFICGLFGGLGWVIAQGVQIYIKHYSPASKSSPSKKSMFNSFDSWKAMECTLGAVGGSGCAVAFLITHKTFKDIVFNMEMNGGIVKLSGSSDLLFLIIWFILLGVDMIHYFVKKPLNTQQLKELKLKGKISDQDYFKKIFNSLPDTTEQYNKIKSLFETYEFIVYAALPFVLISLGNSFVAKIMSVFILYWVLVQEIIFEEKPKKFRIKAMLFSVIGFILILLSLLSDNEFYIILTLIIYTVFYELATLYYLTSREKTVNNDSVSIINKFKVLLCNKSLVISHVYFIICILISLIMII